MAARRQQHTHAPTASTTILVVSVELLAVGLFTLIAGASTEVGNIVVLFMVGLWLLYMITDSKVLTGLSRSLSHVASNA